VTWSSSNDAVATVSASGLATGIAAGETTLTATGAGGAVKGSSTVKVEQRAIVRLGDDHRSICGSVRALSRPHADVGFSQPQRSA